PLAAAPTDPRGADDGLPAAQAASARSAASPWVPAVERALAAPFSAAADAVQARLSVSACSDAVAPDASFRGMTDTTRIAGRTVIREQVGTMGADRVIRKMFGDLELCMVAENAGQDEIGRASC